MWLQLLDYYQACVTYYHQGSDLCKDFDVFFKSIMDDLNVMRCECQQFERVMQNRHTSVNGFCDTNTNSSSNKIEGYLFKKKSKGFKTWCRRWFYLSDNQLIYRWVASQFYMECFSSSPPAILAEIYWLSSLVVNGAQSSIIYPLAVRSI